MHARTYCIVARDAPVAVVFLRGPTRHLRLLRWDLSEDAVAAGQWLVGSVDPATCGVSPDGELIVYEQRIQGRRTLTVVSRPPYFSALACWSYSSPWTGGGFFADAQTLVLGMRLADPEGALPPRLIVTDAWGWFGMNDRGGGSEAGRFGDAVRAEPRAHHGWVMESDHARKASPTRSERRLERWTRARARDYVLVDDRSSAPEDLGTLDWADWAPDGSLLFGRDGCLFRRCGRAEKLVADLGGQVFEPIAPPPEALQWPRRLGRTSGR